MFQFNLTFPEVVAVKILKYLYKRGERVIWYSVCCFTPMGHCKIGGHWWWITTGPLPYYISDMVYFLCWINKAASINSYYNIINKTAHHLSKSSSCSAILSYFKIRFNSLAAELSAADWNLNGVCIIKVKIGHCLYLP